MSGALIPVMTPGESAESYLRRLIPQLKRGVGDGTASTARYIYDSQGREVVGPKGLFVYVGDRLVIAPDIVQIDTADLVEAAVTTAHLKRKAVTTDILADLAVEAGNLATGAVTSMKIATAAVGAAAIAALAVGTAHIANAAIVSAKLADLAVVTAKIDDLAVNNAKIANVSVSKLTAGVIGANQIYVGNNRLELDGINGRFVVRDAAAATRVEIGALSLGGNGIAIRDASGNILMQSGSTAYLSGAFIDSLSANKVTTGTLNAALVSVINLNASNITTGNLTATRINGGLMDFNNFTVSNLTANKIAAGTLQAGVVYAGTVSATQITAGTLGVGVIYAGSVAATQITAGLLNAGVVYTGTLNASQVNAGVLNAMTLNAATINTGSIKFADSISAGVSASGALFGTLQIFALQTTQTSILGQSNSGRGVHGISTSAAGVFGVGYTGVAGEGGLHGVHGKGGTYGVVGDGTSYDFYASGMGTDYGPFTGAHDGLINKISGPEPGDVLVDTLVVNRRSMSSAITITALSTAVGDIPAGVFVWRSPIDEESPPIGMCGDDGEILSSLRHFAMTHDRVAMNAVGEGLVNVCGEGGDIGSGDLLCCSGMPGKAMRQPDNIVRNTTIGKAREAVSFAGADEVRNGIACFYLCG